eukprot:TRINITY_DN2838_c0_g1_i1.p1 TRINITY_DN2838_c0_g1~~TRINITY_DN2838_c0_g1_i1.p1  ORF type:complete len:145 (+),score=40.37 TRINITY_DN2838_c0_g1_i1:56-490(+)
MCIRDRYQRRVRAPSFTAATTMAKIKISELRSKNKNDLLKQLEELKTELSQLRVSKVAGGTANKLAKIHVVRKAIAKVLTVMNQNQKAKLRQFYKDKKYKPTDLRQKKTRAIRRRLTYAEHNAKTVRQLKKIAHFPKRKYAVKA